MDRIDEIRKRNEKLNVSRHMQISAGHVSSDYTYLLERIDELEEELQKVKLDFSRNAVTWSRRIDELERENERLRNAMGDLCNTRTDDDFAMASWWQEWGNLFPLK